MFYKTVVGCLVWGEGRWEGKGGGIVMLSGEWLVGGGCCLRGKYLDFRY